MGALLGCVHMELPPLELALWSVLGLQNGRFDGAYTPSEVFAAIDALTRLNGTGSDNDTEELRFLRAECQERWVDELFLGRPVVTLADVLEWWRQIPSECR